MLEHLGRGDATHQAAANAIVHAIEAVLRDGPRTPDMGGKASTTDVGRAIAESI